VKLTEISDGGRFTDSALVTNYPLPKVSLTHTILLYAGSSINLQAGGGYAGYLWSTGSTDSVIPVRDQGSYGVYVKDIHCCLNSDTTYVKVFKYFMPNVLSPNNNGLNDEFKVTGLYKNIIFKMNIFDRWGRMIFGSDDIDKGWNGNSKGQYCPDDT